MARGKSVRCTDKNLVARFLKFECGYTVQLNEAHTDVQLRFVRKLHAKKCSDCNGCGEIIEVANNRHGLSVNKASTAMTQSLLQAGIELEVQSKLGAKNDPIRHMFNKHVRNHRVCTCCKPEVPEAPPLGFVITEDVPDEVIYYGSLSIEYQE